ncbi:Site-specific recombinase XerD [Mucilaginibacter pineti]|uniref:Site-specific recombinase XerD n=1 Tax=Mucilaginibacter pineti TaxID=1391627 RepID=A0A1G7INR6_9SPHI|nr:site-specific integrase [Mucilaginibacter pineti]SDF14311.1 Site-specific recombinase XerD [Mucilaginibacter pineti]
MLENSFGLLFFLKTSGGRKQTVKHVYLRITVNGVARELSTRMHWYTDRWHQGSGRATGNREDARILNSFLDTLTARIYEERTALLSAGKPITAVALKNRITGKNQNHTLLAVFGEHNNHMAQLVGREYAPATCTRFKTAMAHTRAFIRWKYEQDDLDLRELNYEFVKDFEFYLKSNRHCAHNSAMKYISNVRKIVLQCVLKGWLPANPFLGFKMKLREVRRIPLNAAELRTLAISVMPSPRLELVRDIFLFSCYTGLAWIDVRQLTRAEIAEENDGELWIRTRRRKTDSPTRLPLLPEARRIIERYRNHPKCKAGMLVLPVLSNQKMNCYLKEIALLCSITKRLTFHIARHTFATTVTLANGVPLNTVSKLLGHKSIQQTEHYARLSDEVIREDMALLKVRLSQNGFAGLPVGVNCN